MKVVLDNWVKLEPGVEVRLRFREYRVATRQITDPYFKTARMVESLLFLVSHVNGEEVDKTFSVTSERLSQEFEPYLEDSSFKLYEWTLVKDAAGFVAPRIVSRRRI